MAETLGYALRQAPLGFARDKQGKLGANEPAATKRPPCLALGPVFPDQAVDPTKLFCIGGDQRQSVAQGLTRDQHVIRANRFPGGFQCRTHPSRTARVFLLKGQQAQRTREECFHPSGVGVLVSAVVNSIPEFQGNDSRHQYLGADTLAVYPCHLSGQFLSRGLQPVLRHQPGLAPQPHLRPRKRPSPQHLVRGHLDGRPD